MQLPLIKKAKEMGYITHVFAWEAGDVGEKEADYFYPISIIEKEEILKKCEEIHISGICSIASDIAVITVNYVAEKLGLTGNSIASTDKCTNKYAMRLAFEKNGDPSPKSILISDINQLVNKSFSYPVIVKPTDRSGSRGIYKVEKPEKLENAVKLSLEVGFKHQVLVEEFVEGQEYSVEYISYNGMHTFLAITHKYTTGAPNFIETKHLEPAPIDENLLQNVKKIVTHALNSLDIKNGASHSELKIAKDGTIKLIEIGARMGGDCIGSDLVCYSTGYDFVKMVIDVACGHAPDFSKVCDPIPVESVFIFTEKDLEEFKNMKKNSPEKILKVVDYHPEKIGHITDSSNRAGCYIRRAL